MSQTAVIHEHKAVPQPKQHGKPGGFLAQANIFTGLIGGVVTAGVTYFIGDKLVPWGTV